MRHPALLQKLYSTRKITVQLMLRRLRLLRRPTPHVQYHCASPHSDAHGHELDRRGFERRIPADMTAQLTIVNFYFLFFFQTKLLKFSSGATCCCHLCSPYTFLAARGFNNQCIFTQSVSLHVRKDIVAHDPLTTQLILWAGLGRQCNSASAKTSELGYSHLTDFERRVR
jgi:hypothetical protein